MLYMDIVIKTLDDKISKNKNIAFMYLGAHGSKYTGAINNQLQLISHVQTKLMLMFG